MKTEKLKSGITKIDRRSFLKTSTVSMSGLILGMHISCSRPQKEEEREKASFEPNVFLTINEMGDINIIAHRSEMGQGVRTALPLILADELEADWKRVNVVQAVGDKKYGDQNTDGSFTVRMFYMPMRKAGASARMMLEQAAANIWKVDVAECRANNHEVVNKSSGKTLSYGELAAEASKLEVPKEDQVKLKENSDLKLIGKSTPIVDLEDMVTGKAHYGMDTHIDGIKVALIARPPVAGGKVKSHNAEKTMKVPGVVKVLILESPGFPTGFDHPLGGVVVVADNTWSAMKGREALEIDWDDGVNADYDTDIYIKELKQLARKKGNSRREQGDVDKAFETASRKLEASYVLPHLSHAPMEPPNAVAHFKEGKCEIFSPTQHPQWVRSSVAKALGIEEQNVTVNVTLLGGGFGRKSKPEFSVEAAKISKESGLPIKLIWTREDDIKNDFYHACSVQHVRVALDKDNKVTAWNHRSLYPSIGGTADKSVIEPSAGEIGMGFVDFPYDISNIRCETNKAETKTRVGWLRSVANIQQAFAVGSMLDEVAVARKMDPVKNLLDLLGSDRKINFDKLVSKFSNYGEPLSAYPWDTSRHRKVIELVADKSNWGKSLPKGQGQVIVAHRNFLTYVACVVEVKFENGKMTIPEVHYAVDCGKVINRDRVISQFEGGAIFASSATLKSAISFKKGRVQQNNFNDYQVARIADAPENIYVHLVDSEESPTGVGEPPVPPFSAALCNAIYKATGKRIRELPIQKV
ncbi:xanthine dehydrogenase family protein molybdopterin-binding subunit [Xanthovirga aplysinae]|uniref:xanthine dehydrogenase family protein molybdopterin-binding subunit n=1 Tax=Xanthovirga aplysinae TaxID=2529853 RepID=UPI0012BC88D2|nr:molybdopterin cofactor-binding domain-containing protein [Xanthovirga aplysinae]MTI32883.1 xanthine dehydrogenase family protein molybdopterin-binding subunit [Xanthovirga aplysinae]